VIFGAKTVFSPNESCLYPKRGGLAVLGGYTPKALQLSASPELLGKES
jgi:hypothetical protein